MHDPEKTVVPTEPLPDATWLVETPNPVLDETRPYSDPNPDPNASVKSAPSQNAVVNVGRYHVEKVLGKGAFGVVYLAHDDELKRRVAIKVPQANRIRSPQDAEAYLVEAQNLAKLDHPHIVPVYDVGRSEDGLPFVVSKFIEGHDLSKRLKESRLSFRESVQLVALMAEALQYSHQQRLVHRDVKPGNILIDTSNKPFLVDFGLALSEEDFGKDSGILGTPGYMSPEQANGEGHLVDGRSDIYSLGVVLYELLIGKRPFEAPSIRQLLSMITSAEPRPLRQIDPAIPKELERITLKALGKRASERYATGLDFADDLNHWLKPVATVEKGQGSIKIIPKGLRSFDAEDTDFFLELLPGPRDRDGLPETLRFWKTRLEETDADKTFRVGVIYGPSGCGKSSFVKAGLLPRLANSVRVVYVEATAEDTETRLLRGLEKACPGLPKDLSLREAIAHLRRTDRVRHKMILIADQFEQWLHGSRNQENAELVQALRQCDGERVQCLVMVRDDFWLAVSRFMKTLEIRIVEGQNSALVDLFDLRHAQKVLAAFGKAYGMLPDDGVLTKEQETFLEKAVADLAQEDKVISVRLALFAEMVKSKPWTPATLKAMGGTEGVGVTFLEETFSAATAPPERRYHQNAARGVLNALLPESGTNIKGHMRSHEELLAASGYGNRPSDFEDLIRILDSEIRLITPTDAEGVRDSGLGVGNADSESSSSLTPSAQPLTACYQLAHDYLVPSLRDWLTRKQKETKRGRAELLLADRAAVWNARPENRQLPSLLQWLSIRWRTLNTNWTQSQQKMMQKAGRFHALRCSIYGLLAVVASATSWVIREGVIEQQKLTQADGLVQAVLTADTAHVSATIGEMTEFRKWTDPLLREAFDKAAANSRQKLHTSLALLPVDATQADYIHDRLLDAEPHEVPVIRDALAPHKEALRDKLWTVAEAPDKGHESQRLRAASALAKFDAQSPRWEKVQADVVNDLVNVPAVYLAVWMESLRPVRLKLLAPLSEVFASLNRREVERSLATDILADFAADQPQSLADLVMAADSPQFAVLFPKLKDRAEQALPVLLGIIDRKLPLDAKDEIKEALAKQQANAAVALLRLNQPAKVWPLLQHSPDPRVRSYLIHRLSPLGADAKSLIQRLDEESDLTIRRALILSLGEYGEKEVSASDREALLPKFQEMYRTASDPGLHAATEWLLRAWKQEEWLKQLTEELAKDNEQRLDNIKKELTSKTGSASGVSPQWYVNGQGQTFAVIPGPLEFVMGSPTAEAGRKTNELQHQKRIGRTFAIAAKLVTVEQYQRFDKSYTFSNLPPGPVVNQSWDQAAAYCNWLSKQEGIAEAQWCYEINGTETKLKDRYLSLIGYRLPTEAEMEYSMRAGSSTSRYFGETEELLPKYAWCQLNALGHTWPVGSLKPNDLGLFDVQGNASTWCQKISQDYPPTKAGETSDDREDDAPITGTTGLVVRGASFASHPSNLRSAYRSNRVPAIKNDSYGFRLARTFAP